MPVIIDQAGRRFNADETDGVSRRHSQTPAEKLAAVRPPTAA